MGTFMGIALAKPEVEKMMQVVITHVKPTIDEENIEVTHYLHRTAPITEIESISSDNVLRVTDNNGHNYIVMVASQNH